MGNILKNIKSYSALVIIIAIYHVIPNCTDITLSAGQALLITVGLTIILGGHD